MALGAAGVDLANATGGDFILIMFVMSFGIIGGLVLSPIFGEKIHTGSMKMKEKDARWGALGNSVFMLAIIVAFVIPMFFDGPVKLLTLLTSCIVSYVLMAVSRKYKIAWLGNFILVFTMLIAMASAVLWQALLG